MHMKLSAYIRGKKDLMKNLYYVVMMIVSSARFVYDIIKDMNNKDK